MLTRMQRFCAGAAIAAFALVSCTPRYSVNPRSFQGRKIDTKALVTLGPGDTFEVRVFGEADLSGTYRVSERGKIRFPLVGILHVDGLTPSEIEEKLRQRLGAKYLRDPQVNVFVKEFNSKKIFVFGEVNKPGTFVFEPSMTIVQIITLAGGFTKTAWKNRTNVTRIVEGRERKIQVPVEAIGEGREQNFELKPGDIVFVPESPL
jgi:polysaccharide export outer membrane protein